MHLFSQWTVQGMKQDECIATHSYTLLTKGAQLQCYCIVCVWVWNAWSWNHSRRRRIFKLGNKALKYFDAADYLLCHFKPNEDIIKSCKQLNSVDLESLTHDERIQCLSYEFVDGTHYPKCLKQFVGVLKALHSTQWCMIGKHYIYTRHQLPQILSRRSLMSWC